MPILTPSRSSNLEFNCRTSSLHYFRTHFSGEKCWLSLVVREDDKFYQIFSWKGKFVPRVILLTLLGHGNQEKRFLRLFKALKSELKHIQRKYGSHIESKLQSEILSKEVSMFFSWASISGPYSLSPANHSYPPVCKPNTKLIRRSRRNSWSWEVWKRMYRRYPRHFLRQLLQPLQLQQDEEDALNSYNDRPLAFDSCPRTNQSFWRSFCSLTPKSVWTILTAWMSAVLFYLFICTKAMWTMSFKWIINCWAMGTFFFVKEDFVRDIVHVHQIIHGNKSEEATWYSPPALSLWRGNRSLERINLSSESFVN